MFTYLVVTFCALSAPDNCTEHRMALVYPAPICPPYIAKARPGWRVEEWRCEKDPPREEAGAGAAQSDA